MKKMILWFLMVILCVGQISAAQAAVVECAAQRLDVAEFAHYPSYSLDMQSGKWGVRTHQADALLDRFWNESSASQSFCVFHVEIEGNANTGVWMPVMRFYYASSSKTVRATAVSLLVDGTRYDFAASTEMVQVGKRMAECTSVPLTCEGVEAIRALLKGRNVSVRLMGEEIFTTTLDLNASSDRRQLEASSLSGIQAALNLLEKAGMERYQLWDLSANAWEKEYGFAPAYQKNTVVKNIGKSQTDDEFGMILPGTQSQAAQDARQVLTTMGFLSPVSSSSSNRVFDDQASAAARRAQRYLGLIETGCMDAQLISALASGPRQNAQHHVEFSMLEGTAGVVLSRYWFANGVSPAQNQAEARMANNRDHVLLAADGWIKNYSKNELRLFMQLNAQLIYENEYAFDATILCERDQGTALDMTMLPLDVARLVVYAEIPAHLAQDADADWRLEISTNDQRLEYELQ